jgi:NADPH-dependent 2,4-dienoyl-CoA reductase/sulfur reductase-like enzyme
VLRERKRHTAREDMPGGCTARHGSDYRMMSFDVVVVGAGPAGMKAAAVAAKHGATVCLIDDNSQSGGQIWRGSDEHGDHRFPELQESLKESCVVLRSESSVVAQPAPGVLRIETAAGFEDVRYRRIILATGARERFLPFPGWTLQGVMGAGGLQAMVKAGLPVAGKRIVLSGSGPLLLAVAAALAKRGARILGIFEQASAARVAKLGVQLLRFPGKLRDAAAYRITTRHSPYQTSAWVVDARGDELLHSVTVSVNGALRRIECDYLGCGFHLVPNLELPRLLRCQIQSGCVVVDDTQQTSVPCVYCAGDSTGIGGLEKSLCEGEIAGLVCAGQSVAHLLKRRQTQAQFARYLDQAFALRPELREIADSETFVCRCEDVPRKMLDTKYSWREAKLHTRCGMGPCQGRICGPAAEFLFGWNSEHARPPVFPARVSTIASPIKASSDTV